jgi:hypothetical protein
MAEKNKAPLEGRAGPVLQEYDCKEEHTASARRREMRSTAVEGDIGP